MKLLGSTLAVYDVRDLEALVRRALDNQLRGWGARLAQDEYEDALAYLITKAWELSLVYRPTPGLAFSTYCTRIVRKRVVDWYRQRFHDARYGEPRPVVVSLEWLAEEFDRPRLEVVDELQELRQEEVLVRVAVGC